MGRRGIAGSMAGGTVETQQLIDTCVKNGIYPNIEVIPIQDLDKAFDRILAKDVRYRFVVDMSSLRR